MQNNERSATLAAIMDLCQEQSVIMEAYDFLDEKRLLLAAELLRQMKVYESLRKTYDSLQQQAEIALMLCVKRHGLQGTALYPAVYLDDAQVQVTQQSFIGIQLTETQLLIGEGMGTESVCASPEAVYCTELFKKMIQQAAKLAGVSGNLHRLIEEYRRTERRARALENVVIPEVRQSLKDMLGYMEEQEQEEIVRVHSHARVHSVF